MLPRLGAGQVRSARCAMPQILEAGQVRPIVGSASCSFSSPTHSSMFKFEFSLLASFEYTFYGSLFGFLRVIANLSLVSWRGKQAMRTLARQQAKESSRDSRKLIRISLVRHKCHYFFTFYPSLLIAMPFTLSNVALPEHRTASGSLVKLNSSEIRTGACRTIDQIF